MIFVYQAVIIGAEKDVAEVPLVPLQKGQSTSLIGVVNHMTPVITKEGLVILYPLCDKILCDCANRAPFYFNTPIVTAVMCYTNIPIV